ncbi:ester hydrolase C11orf54 homolog isoform X1 [Salvelinus sp. IW2-2015]|uniref:ester hydrolase C11orf54 homolog isoform X1 n=1 Tax=Salvelinus sp. IW2-2015 TaxID=2691554 RepID=UPI0038D3739F
MSDVRKTEKFQLYVPILEELCDVLQRGLKNNFADAQVCVVDCPDLTQDPFKFPVKGNTLQLLGTLYRFAFSFYFMQLYHREDEMVTKYLFYLSTGLCGKPRITDVGGVPYLVPLVKVDKEYNMNTVSKELELPGAFILGAGAVSSKNVGMNAEMMPLVLTEAEGRPAVNSSWFSSINPDNNQCLLEKYSDKFSDCDFGLLANLYACEGKPGKVIEVRAKRRIGEESLVGALRKTMEEHYPDKSLALGGTFLIQKGKAKIHIMPREFSACPLNSNDDVNKWLKHFEVSAPLICQSVMVSRDPGLDLRVEHTHCFSHHGEGGHYYIDTTPDTVEYLGYFMPAEFVYRIDRPSETHEVGRD